ncbi:Serine/threonine-protein kinase plk2 [Entomophthora muscae]|uniref:Serine/threonine-protein kinase plk2 n=1 Tax=Entomophthora muscae TaxID=34485 RepID=A0ACC2S5X8_9FUNG|nr:Serine/threonine-protein kinase plk2 [Entomophthora muscae]
MLIRQISRGKLGRSFEAVDLESKQLVFCKGVQKSNYSSGLPKLPSLNEARLYTRVHMSDAVKIERQFCVRDQTFVFMSVNQETTLKELFFHQKTLTEPEIHAFMLQLISAVKQFKESHIEHTELNLFNIYYTDDMSLYIKNFGLATQIDVGINYDEIKPVTGFYTSPEVADRSHPSPTDDIIALGEIMYTFLVGTPLDKVEDRETIYFTPPSKISSEAKDLLTRILSDNPEERLNIQQIETHSFFLKFSEPFPTDEPQHNTNSTNIPRAQAKRLVDSDGFTYPIENPDQYIWHKKFKTCSGRSLHSSSSLPRSSVSLESVTE